MEQSGAERARRASKSDHPMTPTISFSLAYSRLPRWHWCRVQSACRRPAPGTHRLRRQQRHDPPCRRRVHRPRRHRHAPKIYGRIKVTGTRPRARFQKMLHHGDQHHPSLTTPRINDRDFYGYVTFSRSGEKNGGLGQHQVNRGSGQGPHIRAADDWKGREVEGRPAAGSRTATMASGVAAAASDNGAPNTASASFDDPFRPIDQVKKLITITITVGRWQFPGDQGHRPPSIAAAGSRPCSLSALAQPDRCWQVSIRAEGEDRPVDDAG